MLVRITKSIKIGCINATIFKFKSLPEPGKPEGHVSGAAKHAGAEHVLQDVRLLDGQHQTKLLLLEEIHLNIIVTYLISECLSG